MRVSLKFSAAVVIAVCCLSTTVIMSQTPQVPAGQAPAALPGAANPTPTATYVGSETCRRCHAPTYERWSKTRMANVVTDPQAASGASSSRTSPSRIRCSRSSSTTSRSSTARKWKQRYFTKVGNDYFPLPAQWDVTQPRVAAVLRAAEHRLVGAALSRPTTCSGRPARSATAAIR